jgi:hypothetical protein
MSPSISHVKYPEPIGDNASQSSSSKHVSTPPPVEFQKYHQSAVDSEDNVPGTRNRVAHETKVY